MIAMNDMTENPPCPWSVDRIYKRDKRTAALFETWAVGYFNMQDLIMFNGLGQYLGGGDTTR